MAIRNDPRVLETLGNLADSQEGYFSAAQASAAQVDRHHLQRLVERGILERDDRGVYRFAIYPHGERAELWRALLWASSSEPKLRAVLSHGTALSMHDVSTINPSQIDITVPRAVRIRRNTPTAYRLHFESYTPEDVTYINGLPLTTLSRTLIDLIVEQKELQFVREAIERAPRRGLLTKQELARLQALFDVGPTIINHLRRLKLARS